MREFIIGTDWWTDCDDAVAMRILARAVGAGEIGVRGIVINAAMEHSVASMEGFWRLEGVPVPPIGLDPKATDFGGRPPYQARLAKSAVSYRSNGDAEDAVRLYRRLLSESEVPLEMVEIGFLNAVAALLTSEADDLSPLDGRALVAAKVKHMWVMAGRWDREVGRENNFARNARAAAAAHVFCRECPVPVTFLGFEVGESVISGGELAAGDHLQAVLCDHGSSCGRRSWDPMLVCLALAGHADKAGYDTVRGQASADPVTGENTFRPSSNGSHAYVIKRHPDSHYAARINTLIASREDVGR